MKKIIFLLASFLALRSFGQDRVFADPAIGSLDLTALDDNSTNGNAISVNRVVKLKIPVYNLSQENAIPPGTCKILIGLGTGIIPDPSYNLSAAPLHEYFTWTAMPPQGGQVRIIGTLVAGLPPDFDGLAVFNVVGDKLTSSSLSVNFMVTNNNPDYTLSDFVDNNTAALSYTIVTGPLPVDFTDFKAEKKSCTINIQWTTENEVNVNRYEIEMSKDGTNYKTVNTVLARGSTKYAFPFSITGEYEAPLLHFRLKAVDNDGKYLYSNTVVTEGTCKITNQWDLYIFPNPDPPGFQSVTITTKTSDFNGRYIINILDNSGRSVSEKEIQLDHVKSFPLFIGKIPAAKYLVQIVNENESGVIGLIKL